MAADNERIAKREKNIRLTHSYTLGGMGAGEIALRLGVSKRQVYNYRREVKEAAVNGQLIAQDTVERLHNLCVDLSASDEVDPRALAALERAKLMYLQYLGPDTDKSHAERAVDTIGAILAQRKAEVAQQSPDASTIIDTNGQTEDG